MSNDTPSRLRNCCITINNWVDEDVTRLRELADVGYIVVAAEVGASGTPHLQGYIQFTKKVGFKWLVTALARRAHILEARGTAAENTDYIKKGSQPHDEWVAHKTAGPNYGQDLQLICEQGEPKVQGKRNDLDAIVASVKEGKRFREIAEDHPIEFIKFSKGIEAYYAANALSRDFKRPLKVEVFYGPTGTGKTYRAMTEHPDAHKQSATMGGWWNGYDNHTVVILDEFRGQIKFAELLQILDVYPVKIQVKGGHRELVHEHVIITSPVHPKNWYPNLTREQEGLVDQLKRRIAKVWYLGARFAEPEDHTDLPWTIAAPDPFAQFGSP